MQTPLAKEGRCRVNGLTVYENIQVAGFGCGCFMSSARIPFTQRMINQINMKILNISAKNIIAYPIRTTANNNPIRYSIIDVAEYNINIQKVLIKNL